MKQERTIMKKNENEEKWLQIEKMKMKEKMKK